MFDLKIVENADTIERDRDVLVIRRGEDVATYKRKMHDWRVLVDVLVNGNSWYGNYEVDEEVRIFWAAALARESKLSNKERERVTKETLAAERRLRGTEEEGETWRSASDAIRKRVQEKVGDECHVVFSAYPTTMNDIPQDNLDEVPVQGKVKIVMDEEEHYESPVLESPTWLELCVHTNDMIHKTGDLHHQFLESIYVLKEEDGVKICQLVMGS